MSYIELILNKSAAKVVVLAFIAAVSVGGLNFASAHYSDSTNTSYEDQHDSDHEDSDHDGDSDHDSDHDSDTEDSHHEDSDKNDDSDHDEDKNDDNKDGDHDEDKDDDEDRDGDKDHDDDKDCDEHDSDHDEDDKDECKTGNPTLVFSKTAFNVTKNTNAASSTASASDVIEYKLIVENKGSAKATAFKIEDNISDVMSLAGITSQNGSTFNPSSNLIYWPATDIAAGQKVEKTFRVQVKSPVPQIADYTMTNTYGNTVNVQVTPPGSTSSNVNLVYFKSAYNVTKGQAANLVSASTSDIIEYTLTVQNTGNASAHNFVFEDNIADVLQLSDIYDLGGATLNQTNKNMTWSATDISAGSSVQKKFKIRVKSTIPQTSDLTMTNIYGNTVNVQVIPGQVQGTIYTAPPTGSTTDLAVVLSAITTMGGAFMLRKKLALIGLQ